MYYLAKGTANRYNRVAAYLAYSRPSWGCATWQRPHCAIDEG